MSLFGLVGTFGGLGGICGAFVATFFTKRLGTIRSFWLGISGFGLVVLIFSRMTSFVPALILIFLIGLPMAAANVAMNPLILRTIPSELLGRVLAVFSTCISVITILAVIVVSTLASTLSSFHASLFGMNFGVYDTIFAFCGLLNIIVGIGVMFAFKGVSLEKKQSKE